MSDWTPGPWVVGNVFPLTFGVQHGNGTEPIGFVYGPASAEHSEYGRRAIANTRLIAAAPEMANALKQCERLLTDVAVGIVSRRRINEQLPDALRMIRAALAKAKGEA